LSSDVNVAFLSNKDHPHLEQSFHLHLIESSSRQSHDTYTIERDEFDRVICSPDIQYTSIKGTVSYWRCSSAITVCNLRKETSWSSVLSFSKADVDLESDASLNILASRQ
jgi:hypothetical protein